MKATINPEILQSLRNEGVATPEPYQSLEAFMGALGVGTEPSDELPYMNKTQVKILLALLAATQEYSEAKEEDRESKSSKLKIDSLINVIWSDGTGEYSQETYNQETFNVEMALLAQWGLVRMLGDCFLPNLEERPQAPVPYEMPVMTREEAEAFFYIDPSFMHQSSQVSLPNTPHSLNLESGPVAPTNSPALGPMQTVSRQPSPMPINHKRHRVDDGDNVDASDAEDEGEVEVKSKDEHRKSKKFKYKDILLKLNELQAEVKGFRQEVAELKTGVDSNKQLMNCLGEDLLDLKDIVQNGVDTTIKRINSLVDSAATRNTNFFGLRSPMGTVAPSASQSPLPVNSESQSSGLPSLPSPFGSPTRN